MLYIKGLPWLLSVQNRPNMENLKALKSRLYIAMVAAVQYLSLKLSFTYIIVSIAIHVV